MELMDRYMKEIEHLNFMLYSGRLTEWNELGLTLSQINTLVALLQKGPIRMGEIASQLGGTLSATTSIVDRLVQKKLVDRVLDPNDRRVVICELTDLGRQPAKRFSQVMSKDASKVTERWKPEQLEAVVEALELLVLSEQKVRNTLATRQK